jgi:hypothetical protein
LKQQLIDHARSNKADEQAMGALQNIPEQEYSGPDQVSKAVARS